MLRSMLADGLKVPIVFLVFNRPELTARVFARIRAARPARLFIVADGPRPGNPHDARKCREVHELIDHQLDWPCAVVRDYAERNLGCGRRVASGINRVFEQVEAAIILEDDCLPEPAFFRYCAELLEKYRDEPRVGLISGSHHQLENTPGRDDYYFCRYGNIWGWATWRRAWQKFDHTMSDWRKWRDSGHLEQLFPDREVRAFWRKTWDEVTAGKHDTWDYQWTYAYMKHGMLGILPRVGLIENIGFGPGATHTLGEHGASAPTGSMTFPLRHPTVITPDHEAEARASRRFFTRRTLLERVAARLRRIRSRWTS